MKVRLAYAIGIAQPVMVNALVTTKDYDVLDIDVTKYYDCTPKGIIEFLDLKKPQYAETAKWGHFGNNFRWDK